MADLWLPPGVTQEMHQNTQRFNAGLLERLQGQPKLDRFDYELRRIDPYLSLFQAPEDPAAGRGLPIRPGFWHLLRQNPGAPWSVMTIEGPEGEYVDALQCPSAVFDQLRKQDLWREGSLRERQAREDKARESEQRIKDEQVEEITQEVLERYAAGNRAFVGWTGNGWTQSARARKEKRN